MNEISKERIEISGVEYTLFLNRQGLVSWELHCEDKLAKLQDKMSEELNDENPFAGVPNDNDEQLAYDTYKKLYWIMLYTEHKFNEKEAGDLYDKAIKEYGEDQIYSLASQMISDTTQDNVSKKEVKNLAALRPKKK